MRKYDSYKDSGIEWIGEIPSHWKKLRLAFNGKFFKGKGVSKGDLSIDGIPVLLYGDIYTKYELKTARLERHIPIEIAQNSFPIEKGDLLFAASGETPDEIGKCICYLGEGEAYASGDVIVFRQKQNDSIFLSYLFNSYKVNEQKAKLSKGEIVVHIYSGQLRDIRFPLPPPQEQTAIAAYLDRKTAEIDELIADKKRLLELYEEEKTAIINQAVTKGLPAEAAAQAGINPDVPMKDSGIEWLGDIPEHWEVKRIDRIANIVRGNTGFKKDELLDAGEYVALQYGKTYKVNEVNDSFSFYINSEFYKSNQIVQFGDVILISTSETLEDLGHSCFYARQDLGLLGGEQILLRPIVSSVLGKYLFYSSKVFCVQLRKFARGIKVFRFNTDNLKEMYTVVPPLEEQQSIVRHIETECARIDAKKTKTEKLIELLTEYRTALISEVVTGKIRVT